MAKKKRTTLAHWLQYAGFRTMESVLKLVSIQSSFSLGEFLGRSASRFPSKYRKTIVQNLELAFREEKSSDEIAELTERVFELTFANLVSSIRIPFLSEDEIDELVTVENKQLLIAAESGGTGIVILVPHMGNWEILAQALATFHKILPDTLGGTHYRPLNNPPMNALVERRRKKRGIVLFSKRTSLHTLTSFLREGNAIAILADQRVGRRGTICDFFGLPTDCSPLPALLAKRTGASVICLHCETTGTATWDLKFSPVEGNETAACMKALEMAWRASPEDVFWFQDRWKYQIKHGHISIPHS